MKKTTLYHFSNSNNSSHDLEKAGKSCTLKLNANKEHMLTCYKVMGNKRISWTLYTYTIL